MATNDQPLAGKTIAVTRPAQQATELTTALETRGATVIAAPAIMIAPPDDSAPLQEAVEQIASYDWLIFTSVNGVMAWFQAMAALGRTTADLARLRIGAIGPATAQAVESYDLAVALMPDTYIAEGILAAIGDVRGQRICLPRAAETRDTLVVGLVARGAVVNEIAAYRTVADPRGAEILPMLRSGTVDGLTFTSSSTVRFLLQSLAEAGVTREEIMALLAPVAIVCIGPITAATARDGGLHVTATAASFTGDGVVAALVEALGHHVHVKAGE
jgi:uroporphyrinogen-III synthase